MNDDSYIGEIRLFPYNFVPRGWLECAGQVIAISANTSLFSVIGGHYGGNGTTTFALPDLRGAAAMGCGNSPVLGTTISTGTFMGAERVALDAANVPVHSHGLQRKGASSVAHKTNVANTNANLGQLAVFYDGVNTELVPHLQPGTTTPDTRFGDGSISADGGVSTPQPHENMQPFLVMTYAIATEGLYPARF